MTLTKFILIFYMASRYGENLIEVGQTEQFLGILDRLHLTVSRTHKKISFIPAQSVMSKLIETSESDTSTSDGPLVFDASY